MQNAFPLYIGEILRIPRKTIPICIGATLHTLHKTIPICIGTSVAPIIGSVIGNTLYRLGFMNIGIGSVHLVNCWLI